MSNNVIPFKPRTDNKGDGVVLVPEHQEPILGCHCMSMSFEIMLNSKKIRCRRCGNVLPIAWDWVEEKP